MTLTVSSTTNTTEVYGTNRTNNTKTTSKSLFGAEENTGSTKPKKEASGRKSDAWRQQFIKNHKGEYNIIAKVGTSFNGKKYTYYEITAKKDVNLAKLKSDLGIAAGVVSDNNDGYGKYDNKGHYIENKAMKGVTIKIPTGTLGETIDDRSFFEQVGDAAKAVWNEIF